jgi:hypothetical protein
MEIKIPRQARDGNGLNREGCGAEGRRQPSAQTPKAVNAVNEATTRGRTLHAPTSPMRKTVFSKPSYASGSDTRFGRFFLCFFIQICLFSSLNFLVFVFRRCRSEQADLLTCYPTLQTSAVMSLFNDSFLQCA